MRIKNFPNLKILVNKKSYISSLIDSVKKNKMTLGPKCEILENKLKEYFGVKHAILTTSGTSALMMASLALNVSNDDKVLCSNLAWVAATNPILIMGGKIIVVDTKRHSELVSFDELNKKIIQFKPKFVILIHLNGQPTYNKKFDQLKKKYKFKVIEDAAQAFLSCAENKLKCGTKYEIGCFSLSIAKPIHMVYGGFCLTNNQKIADKLKAIRDNGVYKKNLSRQLSTSKGLNLKPSDLHAGIGLENLKNVNIIKNKLIKNFKLYEKGIKNPKIKIIKLEGKYSVPNFAAVLVNDFKKFKKFCELKKIGVSKGCTTLTETGLIFSNRKYLRNSLEVSKKLFRLPFGSGYKETEIKSIISILNKF